MQPTGHRGGVDYLKYDFCGLEKVPPKQKVPKELYASRRYDHKRNAYGVKSGLDQVGWETSGWINQCDPRGWTQVCVCVCATAKRSRLSSLTFHTRVSSPLSLSRARSGTFASTWAGA